MCIDNEFWVKYFSTNNEVEQLKLIKTLPIWGDWKGIDIALVTPTLLKSYIDDVYVHLCTKI